jgi:hypothetical protein
MDPAGLGRRLPNSLDGILPLSNMTYRMNQQHEIGLCTHKKPFFQCPWVYNQVKIILFHRIVY